MFRNIKILCESSLSEMRLVYIRGLGGSVSEAPELPQPTLEESLKKAHEEVSANFGKRLEEKKAEILAFIGECKKSPYQKGQWKQWNQELLKAMGVQSDSEESAQGLVRRLEEYLISRGTKLTVEGKFGPNGLTALETYMSGLDKKEGWVEGVTKTAFFDKDNQSYYLTHDGRWIDSEHKEVNLEKVLPILAGTAEPNEKGYYEIKSPEGISYFVDRKGNAYKNRMPDFEGATGWNDDNPYLAPAVQGEEPEASSSAPSPEKKNDLLADQLYVIGADGKPDYQGDFYFRLSDGTFRNSDYEEVPATTALAAIASEIYQTPDNRRYYMVKEDSGAVIAYYNEKGERQNGRPVDSYRVERPAAV